MRSEATTYGTITGRFTHTGGHIHEAADLYTCLARIWGTTRPRAKLRAYHAAYGLLTPHPAADRALLEWFLGSYHAP